MMTDHNILGCQYYGEAYQISGGLAPIALDAQNQKAKAKTRKRPPIAKTMASMTTSALELVGWDEVKCRPIYRHVPKSAVAANAKKTKVDIGGGGAARDGDGIASLEEGFSSLGKANGSVKFGGKATVSKRSSNRRARTISLSPVQGNSGKKVRWGDDDADGVIAEERTMSPLVLAAADAEDEAIQTACDQVNNFRNTTSSSHL